MPRPGHSSCKNHDRTAVENNMAGEALPPSKHLTGPASPGARSARQGDDRSILSQTEASSKGGDAMRKGFCLSVVAGLAALSLAAFTAGADGADAVAKVTGGGQAMFDDPRFEEMGTPTTTFGMGVTILSDG